MAIVFYNINDREREKILCDKLANFEKLIIENSDLIELLIL